MPIDIVDLSRVERKLKKIPKDIIKRLQRWVMYVERIGLVETRRTPGFHDEPLKGEWRGYRSVRLGIKWRVIYKHKKDGSINVIIVKEIIPHDY